MVVGADADANDAHDIYSLDGEFLGRHQGLMYHTLGQRQGLGIGGKANHGDAPWYVVGKDLDNNILQVAQGNDHPALFKSVLHTGAVFWVSEEPVTEPIRVMAKTRYRQPDQACQVVPTDSGYRVEFDRPQRAITPGQSVVFYQGELCLGGGVIESTAE